MKLPFRLTDFHSLWKAFEDQLASAKFSSGGFMSADVTKTSFPLNMQCCMPVSCAVCVASVAFCVSTSINLQLEGDKNVGRRLGDSDDQIIVISGQKG